MNVVAYVFLLGLAGILYVWRSHNHVVPAVAEGSVYRYNYSYVDSTGRALPFTPFPASYTELLKIGACPNADCLSIARAVQDRGVPEAVLLGIIEVESGFRTDVVSESGCVGLMQLSRRAVNAVTAAPRPDRAALKAIALNVSVGAAYLKSVHESFVKSGLESSDEYTYSIMAYNAGPSAVKKAVAGKGEISLRYYHAVTAAISRWKERGI